MSTNQNDKNYDCYKRALPTEPTFTLLARDPSAPMLIRLWADLREVQINLKNRPETDVKQVEEARVRADEMEEWRIEHADEWKTTPLAQAAMSNTLNTQDE